MLVRQVASFGYGTVLYEVFINGENKKKLHSFIPFISFSPDTFHTQKFALFSFFFKTTFQFAYEVC